MNFFQVLFEPANLKFLLNILFFVLLVLIVLAAVINMWRKALPFAWRTIFFIILFILGIFLARPIGNALGKMDVSLFGKQITVNETAVPLTTLLETIENVIHTIASNDRDSIIYLAVTNQELAALIHSTAVMICRYLAFFLWSICAVIFGGLIAWGLYHLAIKWIFPKRVRQFKKRWVSFLIGLVNSTMIATMLLTPITAAVNAVNIGLKKNPSAEIVDQESYDRILGWADAYDSSIFAKVLFGIQDSEGRSLDVMIMDYATKTDYQGDQLIFSQQISDIANMAENLIAAGIFENGTTITASTFLSKAIVSAFLTSIIDSDFLLKLLPTLFQVALTYADQKDIIDATYVDLTDLSWAEELAVLDEIYASLYDSGLIGNLADGQGLVIPLDDGDYASMHTALEMIDRSALMNRLFPAIVYTYVHQKDGDGTPSTLSQYLPTTWDDYQGIHWGSELLAFYDTLYQLKKQEIDLVALLTKSGEKKEETLPSYTFKNGFLPFILPVEEKTEDSSLLGILIDRFADVVGILTGYDAQGVAISDSPYAILLDSTLLMRAMDKILTKVIQDTLDEQKNTGISETDLQNGLSQLQTKADYQYETYCLLRFVSTIFQNENIHLDTGAIDIQDATVRATLIEVSPLMDQSKVLSSILPGMFETMLQDLSFGENIPLTGKDLNFRQIQFARELPLLLNGYEEVLTISDALQGTTASEILNQLQPSSLENVLNLLYDSKILNPEGKKNQNFYTVLDQIFDNERFKEMGLSKKVSYDSIANWHAENAAIAHIFATIKNEDMVSILTGDHETTLTDLNAMSIQTLFAAIDASQLIRATFGDVLDQVLISSLETEITDISFNNVTNWTEEGIHLSYAIQSFQTLGTTLQDLDWLNSDPSFTEPLLKELASLQLFQKGDENFFGTYMWEDLKRDSTLQDYLKDYPTQGDSYEMSRVDFASITDWKEDEGESHHIMQVIRAFQSVYEDDFGPIRWDEIGQEKPGDYGLHVVTSGQASTEQLRTIVSALSEAPSLRLMAVHAVDESVKHMSFAELDIDFSKAHIAFLLDLSQEERKEELLMLPTIYEASDHVRDEADHIVSSAVEILLRTSHQSRIFNSLEENPSPRTTLTVFEQMITAIATEAKLGESISGSTDPLVQKSAIDALVLSIPNQMGKLDEEDGWQDEEQGEITKIVRVLSLYETAGMSDFTSQSLLSLSRDTFVQLLQSVNHSTIFHRAILDFFQKASDAIGIESLVSLQTPDYQLTRLKEDGTVWTTAEKIEQYDREIVLYANVIDEAKIGVEEDGTIKMFDFKTEEGSQNDLTRFVTPVENGGYGKSTVAFMHFLKESKIMEPVRSEMLYTMLAQIGKEEYVRPLAGTKEQKIAKIESFFAPSKASDGTWIDYQMDADVEGRSLDTILPIFTQEMMEISSLDDIATQNETLYQTIVATTGFDAQGNPKRAYFASEFVAGYLTKNGPTQENQIIWIVERENACDDFSKLNESSASQIRDILQVKAEYKAMIALQSDLEVESEEAQRFIQAMAKLDTYHDEENPDRFDIIDKLSNSLFYESVGEQTITYENTSMTLNQAFAYAGADTFAKQGELMVRVASQLN